MPILIHCTHSKLIGNNPPDPKAKTHNLFKIILTTNYYNQGNDILGINPRNSNNYYDHAN